MAVTQTIKNYVDKAGLQEFLSKIKSYYSNTSSITNPSAVGYAVEAGKASTAAALAEKRTISITGDAEGSVSTTFASDANIKVSIADATETTHGLLSTDDKKKLNSLATITGVTTGAIIDGVTDSSVSGLNFSADGVISLNLSNYATKGDLSSVFKFKGTVENYSKLTEKTGMVVGDVYHIGDTHTEYVWVEGSSTDNKEEHKVAHWEELGLSVDLSPYLTRDSAETTYRKKTDKILVSEISNTTATTGGVTEYGLDDYIKKTKVDEATTADKVAKSLNIKEPGKEEFTTYNGSEEVSIDISNIATSEAVNKKADKLASTAEGHILKADANGNLADTGVTSAVLVGGSVADGNTSFVTGGDVYSAINKMEHQDTTYAFANGSDGKFTVTPTVTKDGTATTGAAITVTTGADANKLESVSVKGPGETAYTALTIDANKNANLDLSDYALYASIQALSTSEIDSLFN